ncbi:hypothetical protein M5K25_020245 [Dendrobium thyrsiflorum]|uniref:Uncharacterized protein n=1 Tax=Dendrobium thyrsiflorum TaxID=117978 RepID=A0ABD0UGF6_DENTH
MSIKRSMIKGINIDRPFKLLQKGGGAKRRKKEEPNQRKGGRRKSPLATKLLLEHRPDFSWTTSCRRIFTRPFTEALEKRSEEEKELIRRRKRALLPPISSSTTSGCLPDRRPTRNFRRTTGFHTTVLLTSFTDNGLSDLRHPLTMVFSTSIAHRIRSLRPPLPTIVLPTSVATQQSFQPPSLIDYDPSDLRRMTTILLTFIASQRSF